MKLFSSILKLLAERGFVRSAPLHQRLHRLEALETRCVLSGFSMPPMMDYHGDFIRGGADWDGPEEHGPGPDFDGGTGSFRSSGPLAEGEFGPPQNLGGELRTPFGEYLAAPEHELLPAPGDFSHVAPTLITVIVVIHSPAAAPAEATPPPTFSAVERPSRTLELNLNSTASLREPNTSGIAAGAASVVAVGDGALPRSTVSFSSLATTTETLGLRTQKEDAARDEDTAQKRLSKESTADQEKANQAVGLIEIATSEDTHRLKRKAEKDSVALEQFSDQEPGRLVTVFSSMTKATPVLRLPLPAESHDLVLAAWSPEDAGLVEILAADVAGPAGRRSLDARPAPITLRASSAADLQAEVGHFQAFDFASEPPVDSPLISTIVNPLVSATPPQPAPREKAE
jgi:hypothetical protein